MNNLIDTPLRTIRSLLHSNFVKYVIVGLISMAIEMSLLIGMVEYLKVPYLESNVVAFVLTNIVNYILSRLWVFEKTGRRKRVEFFWFAVFQVFSLGISQGVMWLGVDHLGIDYKITKVISIAIIVAWNFLTRKHFVFAKARESQSTEQL